MSITLSGNGQSKSHYATDDDETVVWRRSACGLLAAVGLTGSPGLQATGRGQDGSETSRAGDCSERTIRGRYAIKTDGWLVLSVGLRSFAGVGVVTFDGQGHMVNAATTSTHGVIASGVTAGTYSVNEDCTGTMAFPSVSNGQPLTFDIVIASKETIVFVATTAPASLTGSGSRMD